MSYLPLLLAAALVLAPAAHAQVPGPDDTARTELRAITQSMLGAAAPGDTAIWSEYLHERLVHMDESGTCPWRS